MLKLDKLKNLILISLVLLSVACSERNREVNIDLNTEAVKESVFADAGTISKSSGTSVEDVRALVNEKNSIVFVSESSEFMPAAGLLSLNAKGQSILGQSYGIYDIVQSRTLFVDCIACADGRRFGLILQFKLYGQENFSTVAYQGQPVHMDDDFIEIEMDGGFRLKTFNLDSDFSGELAADVQLLVYMDNEELTGKISNLINR